MDFEDIFEECANEPQNNLPTPQDYNFAHKIITEVEAEYIGKNTELIDRMKEIKTLQQEIEQDKDSLKKIKMPKGAGTAKMREMLAKQASEKRNHLRNKIKRAECRLDEIDVETNGQLTKEKEAKAKHLESLKNQKRETAHQEITNKFGEGSWMPTNPYADDL
jgi:dsDNA-specific endonuclease/ATPase MutS2